MPPRAAGRRLLLVSIDGLAAPYLDEPALELPHLRGLMDRGARVGRVRTPLPGVTWPCHTSLITAVPPARHGVLGNVVFDRRDRRLKEHLGDRAYDKESLVSSPTLYDVAHAAGLTTAAVCWPQTRGARTLHFTVPEALDQAVFERSATPALWTALRAEGLPIDRYAAWSDVYVQTPMQDRLTTDVTRHLIARHRPALLLVHYLALDGYQHEFGPASPEARWALGYLDAELGRLLAALRQAALLEATAIVVTSDHGFTATRTRILPNVLLRQQGLLRVDETGQVIGGDACVAADGGFGGLTVVRDGDREELLARLARELAALPGVDRVCDPREAGLPEPRAHPHAPDLVLLARPDAYFAGTATGDEPTGPARLRGTHGHPPRGAWLHTAMVAAGPGVRAGARLDGAELTEVGATAAALLGLALPEAAAPLRPLLEG